MVRGDLSCRQLEARDVPAVLTVNSLDDNMVGSGSTGSLRYCIDQANLPGDDTINLSVSGTITLTSGKLFLSDIIGKTTINGPGAGLLTIDGNNASRVFWINGGVAVDIFGLTITNGNAGTETGGGIFSFGSLSVNNVVISGNAARKGGGIDCAVGSVTVVNSTISGNFATQYGGGLSNSANNTTLSVTNSTLSGNTAGIGGGIYSSGLLSVTNSTISGNSATNGFGGGGGVYNLYGTSSFVNSTLSGNSAANGGGVRNFYGTLNVRNTIVAGNTGGDVSGSLSSNTSNLLNMSAAAAGLSTLGNNGGPTKTIPLLPGSPAINTGTAVGAPLTDQRGLPRFGAVDIGAFEVQPIPARVTSITINGGDSQRSRVTSIAVHFDQNVGTPPASAFQLKNQSTLLIPTLAAGVDNSGATTVVNLSFSGNSVESTSLADGRYTLTIAAGAINGGNFDGNGDSISGDDYVLVGDPATNKLFRLFGDGNGDGVVNSTDFLAFRLAFLSSSPTFDFDGDGTVGANDLLAFRLRFLQSA
ncbi:MAG: hypothetical protein K1X57_08625 [Gemmataceae bacterium]|nr:hypothetical protein [Gemmataceae bacterium]